MENLFKNIKYKKWLIFISISLLFLTFELIFLLFGVNFEDIQMEEYAKYMLIKYIVISIILIIIYHKYLKEKIFDFKNNFKKYSHITIKNWFTGFLIMYASNIIISFFITGNGQNEEAVQSLIKSAPYLAFIMTTLFAPFIEEMIFRKSLQDCFNNKTLYMIISGLIFGLIHVAGSSNILEYLLIIPYGALGFMFAKTINETDNIYTTIMMHLLHNGILTILSMVIR